MRELLLATLCCVGATTGANAATIMVPLSCSTLLGCYAITPFDSTLGTLTGASYEIGGDAYQDYFLSKSSDDPITAHITESANIYGSIGVNSVHGSGSSSQFDILLTANYPIEISLGGNFSAAGQLSDLTGLSTPIPFVQFYFSPSADGFTSTPGVYLEVSGSSRSFGWSLFGTLTYTYDPPEVPVDPPVDPPVSNAPEPATWAMMVSGFGFIGATMRRRQRTSVSFA